MYVAFNIGPNGNSPLCVYKPMVIVDLCINQWLLAVQANQSFPIMTALLRLMILFCIAFTLPVVRWRPVGVCLQKPGGLIFPDRATLYITSIEDRQYKDEKISCNGHVNHVLHCFLLTYIFAKVWL